MALKFFRKKDANAQSADDTDVVEHAPDDVDVTADTDADAEADAGEKSRRTRGKRAKPRRKEETLASVLTESEPGAAVDVMRQVDRFVLPEEVAPYGGYVVMVLPTTDSSFGGLSRKQNKNKDKGLIINLMQAGDIEIVITPALLDDDALAIIPEHDTLARMDEFGLLRDARYLWGIAVPSQEDGSLTIFTVPGQREEDADGKLYETVAEIARGDLDITEAINMQLVRGMIDIFNLDAPGYGEDGVVDAMDVITEAYGIRRAQGTMPTTDEYIMILHNKFPQIDPDYDPEADEVDEDDDEDVDVMLGSGDADVVDTEADAEVTDTADAGAVGTSVKVAGVDTEGVNIDAAEDTDAENTNGETDSDADVEGVAEADAADTTEADDDVDSDVSDDAASDVAAAPAAPTAAAPVIDIDALVAQITEQIRENSPAPVPEGLSQEAMDELINRQTAFLLENGLLGGGATGPERRIINQLGHSIEQTTDDLDAAVARNFLNDDLGLRLDTSLFDNTVYGQLPQLHLPDYLSNAQTPWLNDQLEALVRNINSELEADFMRRREVLRQDFVKMLTADIEEISKSVSVTNRNSGYYALQETADRQRDDMQRRQEQREHARRSELKEDFNAKRNQYISRRSEELGAEFDREHRADLDHALRMVGADMQKETENVYNAELALINYKRREDAQQRYGLAQHAVMGFMEDAIKKMHEDEAEMVRGAAQRVEDYVEKMAQDDIRYGEVLREQMDRDTRVTEIREDAERQIEQARKHADEEIARQKDVAEALRAGHEQFVAELKRDTAEYIANADRKVQAVLAEREADREHLALMQQRADEQTAAKEAAVEERAQQAEARLEEYINSQKSDNTTMIIVMVVLSIVMMAAGVALGNVFF